MSGLKKTLKRVYSAALTLMIALMLVVICYLTYCNMTGRLGIIGKYSFVKIVSPSMEPTIHVDTYILAERIGSNEVQIGDVILFYSRDPAIYGMLNTHRVIDINATDNGLMFVTKGDNNAVEDAYPVESGDLVAKYIKSLPAISGVADFFAKPIVFFLLIIIPAGVLILLCVRDVIKKSKEVKIDMLVAEEVERLKKSADDKQEENDNV